MARGLKCKKDCTIPVAKTKAQISFTVTGKLICIFVFAYAKIWFSHNEAHFNTKQELSEIGLFPKIGNKQGTLDIIFEPHSSGFPTRSDANRAVQPQ